MTSTVRLSVQRSKAAAPWCNSIPGRPRCARRTLRLRLTRCPARAVDQVVDELAAADSGRRKVGTARRRSPSPGWSRDRERGFGGGGVERGRVKRRDPTQFGRLLGAAVGTSSVHRAT